MDKSEEARACDHEIEHVQDPEQANSSKPMARPRGRPKGSKNKPKPAPIIPIEDTRGGMNMHYLEIQRGAFVIASVAQLASKFVQNGGGLFVMGAKGIVSSVTVVDATQKRRPLVGLFSILSLSGTIGCTRSTSFTITLSDPSFQTWGGIIFGDFQAVQGPIVVEAVSYQRLESPSDQCDRAVAWLGLGEVARITYAINTH